MVARGTLVRLARDFSALHRRRDALLTMDWPTAARSIGAGPSANRGGPPGGRHRSSGLRGDREVIGTEPAAPRRSGCGAPWRPAGAGLR